MVGAGFRAGGRGGSCVEQRDRNVAMRGTKRDGARGSRSEDQRDFLHRITASPPSLPPPLPHTRRRRRPITYVSRSRSSAPKAFLATAFLTLGHGDTWFYDLILWNGMVRGLGKRRLCMSMVHSMVLHLIKNPEV